MKDEQQHERISDYLTGNMPENDRTVFEADAQANAELQQALAVEKSFAEGVRQVFFKQGLNQLQQLESTLPRIQEPKKGKTVSLWGTTAFKVAASLVVAIIGAIAVLQFNQSNTVNINDQLEPYPLIQSFSVRGQAADSTLKTRAYLAYQNKQYQQAVTYFEQLGASQQDEFTLFYRATGYLQLANYAEAITLYDQYRASYSTLADEAGWFMALAHIKNNQPNKARPILKDVNKNGGDYAQRAGQLLESL